MYDKLEETQEDLVPVCFEMLNQKLFPQNSSVTNNWRQIDSHAQY
jgi:hypothetical protein